MRLTANLLSRYLRRYIERETFQGFRYRCPLRGWRTVKFRKHLYYGEDRPWTEQFKRDNMPNVNLKRILVEPIKEWTVFYGDRVEVMVGKDKGKQGIVNTIIKERNWVYVEGLNCEYQEVKVAEGLPVTGMMREKPLLYPSQVKLVNPANEKPTEIEWRYTEEGQRVRVCINSGRIIPLPEGASMGDDLVIPVQYKDNADKDTAEKELTEITFKPKLMTFEQEIMENLGIKEDRKPAKTFWY